MAQEAVGRHINISFAVLLKIALVIVLGYFLYQIFDILALLFVALILSTALDPWVDFLEHRHLPRTLAVTLIYLVLFVVVTLVVVLMIPPLAKQLGELAQSFPYYYTKILSSVSKFETVGNDQVATSLQSVLQSLGASLGQATSSVVSALAGLFGGLVQFVLTLVITFYLIVDKNGVRRLIRSVTPAKHQPYITQLMNRIQSKLGLWLRGQVFLMLIIGVLSYLGLITLGMPYALVLALWAGLTEIIPYVGPVLGAIPALFLALSVSPLTALFVLILYIVIQQLENNFIVPQVMKKAVGMNPIVSIVVVLIGAKLGGVVGAIISIPVATAVTVFLSDIFGEKWAAENKLET